MAVTNSTNVSSVGGEDRHKHLIKPRNQHSYICYLFIYTYTQARTTTADYTDRDVKKYDRSS